MNSINNLFNLDEAIKWIKENEFKCIALELPVYLLKYSVDLTKYLKSKIDQSFSQDTVEFYTVVLNCCSVDYVSPRHLNGQIDALIRFGKCCLAKLPKGIIEYPVLFIFENNFLTNQATDLIDKFLKDEFKQNESSNNDSKSDSLIIVDTNYLIPTLNLIQNSNNKISIGKFVRFSKNWTFNDKLNDYFIDYSTEFNKRQNYIEFYNYLLDKELNKYKKLYFVGDQLPNSIKILSLLEVVHLNPKDQVINRIQTSKELMKRCSLIEKIKKLDRFGFVFSHSYPDVSPFIDEIKNLAKKKKKQVNFITLVQTTDEFKLGNFPALQSLVLVNNCYCSYLIDNINLHIPLINYREFQIGCGLKQDYGQVTWNEDVQEANEDNFSDQSESNQLLLDDRNTALVENYFKEDRWFGLQVNAGQDEISDLKQGLKGIAMGYKDEKDL